MPSTKVFYTLFIISLLLFQCKIETPNNPPKVLVQEINDTISNSFIEEYWEILGTRGSISRDTFFNCEYFIQGSDIFISFDSSSVWRNTMQFELYPNKIGISYEYFKGGTKFYKQPLNGTQNINNLTLIIDTTSLQYGKLRLDLDYDYTIFLQIPKIEKPLIDWKKNNDPLIHNVKGTCYCNKAKGKINTFANKKDYILRNVNY